MERRWAELPSPLNPGSSGLEVEQGAGGNDEDIVEVVVAGIPSPATTRCRRMAGFLACGSWFPAAFPVFQRNRAAETRRLQLRRQPRLKPPSGVDTSVFPFNPRAFSPFGEPSRIFIGLSVIFSYPSNLLATSGRKPGYRR